MLPCGSHPGPSPPPDQAAGMETALGSERSPLNLAQRILSPLAALRCPKVPPNLRHELFLRSLGSPLALCCLQQWMKRLVYQ